MGSQMTGIGLNGRVARLEASLKPGAGHCRACGLRHVQPLTIELVRRLMGPISAPSTTVLSEAVQNPASKLCLCDPCCGDQRDRALARLSHRLGEDRHA